MSEGEEAEVNFQWQKMSEGDEGEVNFQWQKMSEGDEAEVNFQWQKMSEGDEGEVNFQFQKMSEGDEAEVNFQCQKMSKGDEAEVYSSSHTKLSEPVTCFDLGEDGEEQSRNISFLPPFSRVSSSASESTKSMSSSSMSHSSVIRGAELDARLTPFRLKWSFGVGLSTPVLNLSTRRKSLIAYATTHAGVIYDFFTKEMHLLPGHKNIISDIAVDATGKWLVTVDKGEDSTIIVWDTEERIPVNTIFNPHPDYGTAVVGLSGNAKYLVTVGYEIKPILNFWLWTYGSDKPNDSYTFDSIYKAPVKIRFNPDIQEHIMVAFHRQIVFLQWDTEKRKLLPPIIPAIKNMKQLGHITDCTYVDTCHECVASTDLGYMLIFGSTVYIQPFEEDELSNHKIFVNAVKVSSVGINCMESVDGIIATGDARGHLKFYDKTRKLLFWCQNFSLPSVTSISFNRQKRLYKLRDAADFETDSIDDVGCYLVDCQCEDRSEEYERLYAQLVPSDATLHRLPFIIRDFIVATIDGRVASVDYLLNKCNPLFRKAEAPVAAIDTHDEEPYLVIAYTNGNVRLYNYEMQEMVVEETLPEEFDEESETFCELTTIKFSPSSLHLACGKDNGSLWFLNPVTLTPKTAPPFRPARSKILKLAFSLDSRYFAYYDENSTMILMRYSSNEGEWNFLGKFRSHYKPINDILFTPYLPSRFFSIGGDRHLVEYDLEKSGYGNIELISRERIEQSAIPIAFTYYSPNSDVSDDKYFLTADDQFKYKSLHDVTYMCRSVILAPAYDCYRESPVSKMAVLPKHNDKYLIFANHNQIGIQALPPDGNPYRYVGTIGHPIKLVDFRICYEGKYIFTIGAEDSCVLMWDINVSSVEVMTKLGGTELEPFYCLIEGGIHGWLFKEMQDLFYYMQILHQGENTVLPRIVNDKIPVSELPDLMRACGFYPTEYEIENMIIDIKYRDYDVTKVLKEEVSFLEFVVLYINHRPAHGVNTQALKCAFESFCMAGEGSSSNCITGSSFVTALCERGEIFSTNKAHTCLATLMHAVDEEDGDDDDFSFLPDEIDFHNFLEVILGMDMEREAAIIEEDKVSNSILEDKNLC